MLKDGILIIVKKIKKVELLKIKVMYTKNDLTQEYKRETGEYAYVDGRMTPEYKVWLEEKVIELKNKENE